MELRPVGTIFTHAFPASFSSTNVHPTRITYRVVGHHEVMTIDRRTVMAEQLEAIEVEELPAATVIPFRAFKSFGHWREWAEEWAAEADRLTPPKAKSS